MQTLKRALLFISSFAFIGLFVQFFVMILAAVNAELFIAFTGIQPQILFVY